MKYIPELQVWLTVFFQRRSLPFGDNFRYHHPRNPFSMATRLLRTTASLSQLPRYTSHNKSSHFSIRRRAFSRTSLRLRKDKGSPSNPASRKPELADPNPSLHTVNLFQQIRDAHPAVRFTVYAGLSLMVTVESTFWLHVIRAKFFPSASEEEQEKAEAFMENVREAIAEYKQDLIRNYGRYYGRYVWGVGER
jgi:hypothetical protein